MLKGGDGSWGSQLGAKKKRYATATKYMLQLNPSGYITNTRIHEIIIKILTN